ncbi:MAG: hypothetical protein R2941_02360 [Desulfobacterales bacterium]
MGRFIFAMGCAAVICAVTVFPAWSGDGNMGKNTGSKTLLYAGSGHGPGDGTGNGGSGPKDGTGNGWKRGDCLFPDAAMENPCCGMMAKGRGNGGGNGNGGGHGPGDGTGNGGSGPKDGTGNGSKSGTCINS